METTKDKLRMLAILSFVCFFAVSIGTYFYFNQMNTSALIVSAVFITYYLLFFVTLVFLSLKYEALEKLEEVDDNIVEAQEVALEPAGIAIEQVIEEVEEDKEVAVRSHIGLIAHQLKNHSDALLQSTEDLRDVYDHQQITVVEPIEQPVRQVRNVGKYRYGRDFAKRYVSHKYRRRVR